MIIFCEKCKKDTEPHIDTSTLVNKQVGPGTKAICPTCKSELKMTLFAIKGLFSMKRFFTRKATQAFQYECEKCNDFKSAVLSKDRAQALCEVCKTPFNLTPFMLTALKLAKGSGNLDEQQPGAPRTLRSNKE